MKCVNGWFLVFGTLLHKNKVVESIYLTVTSIRPTVSLRISYVIVSLSFVACIAFLLCSFDIEEVTELR